MQVVFFGHYLAMSKKKPQIVLILGLDFLAVVQRRAIVIPKKYRIYFLSLVSLLHWSLVHYNDGLNSFNMKWNEWIGLIFKGLKLCTVTELLWRVHIFIRFQCTAELGAMVPLQREMRTRKLVYTTEIGWTKSWQSRTYFAWILNWKIGRTLSVAATHQLKIESWLNLITIVAKSFSKLSTKPQSVLSTIKIHDNHHNQFRYNARHVADDICVYNSILPLYCLW